MPCLYLYFTRLCPHPCWYNIDFNVDIFTYRELCLRYHNDRMINYDSAGGVRVNVSNVSNRSLKSVLTMRRIKQSQAGK